MTHPLTDEKALSLFSWERLMDTSQPITIEDAMRTAADWQLEQVIDFLQNNYDPDNRCTLDNAALMVKGAMRPQQQEDN